MYMFLFFLSDCKNRQSFSNDKLFSDVFCAGVENIVENYKNHWITEFYIRHYFFK